MKKTITIVGGRGLMGQLFAHYLIAAGFKINILDKDDWHNAESLLGNCSLALITVPLEHTVAVIKQVAKYLPADKNAILADLSSTKVIPKQTMLNAYPGTVLALHPMFGPTIDSPKQQVILNCGGRGDFSWVIDSFKNLGFTIHDIDADRHDKTMDFVQGIEHFSTCMLSSFLYQQQQSPEDLLAIASPVYKMRLLLMGRILSQDAKLYAAIITSSKERLDLLSKYAEHIKYWVDKLCAGKLDEFIEEWENTRKWMEPFPSTAQTLSDDFLNLLEKNCKI